MSTELSDLPVSDWEPVTSSLVEAIKYIPSMKMLFIRFSGGKVYKYDQVDPSVYSGLMAAERADQKKKADEAMEQAVEPYPVKIEGPIDLMPKINPLLTRVTALTIATHTEAEIVSAERLVIKALIKEVCDTFWDPKEKAYAAHKSICAAEKKHLDPLEAADKILTQKLLDWETSEKKRVALENERIRKEAEEAERKRREEEEAARRERQRIEDERMAVERALFEAEQKKKADEAMEQAAKLAEAGKKEEAERALARAAAQEQLDKLLAEGREAQRRLDAQKAEEEAIRRASEPVYIPTPVVEAPQKVTGFVTAKIWKAKVVDMRLLCRAIADGRTDLLEAVLPNEAFLNAIAKAHKKTDIGIPGVQGVEETSGRSGR